MQYESLVVKQLHVLQEYKVIFETVKIGTAMAILIVALLYNESEILYTMPKQKQVEFRCDDDESLQQVVLGQVIRIEDAFAEGESIDVVGTFGVKPMSSILNTVI